MAETWTISLFIATTCLIASDAKTLPGWLGRAGLVAAALSVFSSATLLVEGLGLREEAMPFVLLPLGMVLSLGWVLLASAALMLGKSPLPRKRGDL